MCLRLQCRDEINIFFPLKGTVRENCVDDTLNYFRRHYFSLKHRQFDYSEISHSEIRQFHNASLLLLLPSHPSKH